MTFAKPIASAITGGKRRRSSRSGSKRRRHHGGSTVPIKGGSGAAEFGLSVYGSGSDQHAVSGGDNTIVMNSAPALSYAGGAPLTPALVAGSGIPLAPIHSGGGELQYSILGGGDDVVVKTPYGGAMVDIAVPAALLLANNVYGRRTTGPIHTIGNMGRSMRRSVSSVGKRMSRSVGRSVRFSPFKGRKGRKSRRTRGGKLRGG